MKIAVVGCGVMGSAFAKHFAKSHSVIVTDRNEAKTRLLAKEIGAAFEKRLTQAVEEAEVILLAVKPKDLQAVAKTIAPVLTKKKILISILAGIPIAYFKKNFPLVPAIRAMPNLALVCGEGVIGLAEEGGAASEKIRETVDSILDGLGLLAWMTEEKLEPLTAISGSGIGFALVLIEAMIDGGVYLGFAPNDSKKFVLQTLKGAIALLQQTQKHPAELKLDISSPGGTTIAGLKVMEEKGVRSGIMETLIACYEKAHQMKKLTEK